MPPPTAQQKELLKEAEGLDQQVIVLLLQGKTADAIPPLHKLVEILRALPQAQLHLAPRLDVLGRLLCMWGEFLQAEPLLNEALEVYRALYPKDKFPHSHPDLALCLLNLASLYESMGAYAKEEPLLRQALEILRQVLGNKHPDYATSLDMLGVCYLYLGLFEKAKLRLHKALEIRKQVLGDKHNEWNKHYEYTISLRNLALLYKNMGDYKRADEFCRQALEITKDVFGEKHPEYAACLRHRADLYLSIGAYAKSEPLCLQALEICRNALGDKHPDYAASLFNLALLYEKMGDYGRAVPLYRQALEIDKQVFEEKRPKYAALHNLAGLYRSTGAYAKSVPRQALEIFKQALGRRGRKPAGANYGRLAGLYVIRKQLLGIKHPDYASSLEKLGTCYLNVGAYEKADPLLRQALETYKQVLGDKHPKYAITLKNLALLQVGVNGAPAGEPLAFQAAEVVRCYLSRIADVQSETQQLNSVKEDFHYLDSFLSVTAAAQTPAGKVYDELLLWKGAVTSRQAAIHRFRANLERSGNKELLTAYDDLLASTRQLANLLGKTPDPRKLPNCRQTVQELSDRVESLEKKLAAASADYRRDLEERHRTSADLARVLPGNAVFIDLVEYNHFLPAAKQQRWERRLAAFVVRPNRAVVRVNVGPAGPIGEAVGKWRKNFDSATGSEIRRLVWEPLAPHLDGATALLISPDGALTRFPFAALPGKRPNSYLIEDQAVAVIAVPQQLPELLAPTSPADPSMLVVGGVNYGDYLSLPHTGPEAQSVREQFQRLYPTAPVSELTGDGATEEAVRRLAGKHRYLHFAMHGDYDPLKLRTGRQTVTGEHPGLLWGLVLAGANRPMAAHRDDGILTAMELGAFDLTGVDLAVLSACQTALGESTAGGEGLLGLQRAFQTAGARSVVASLWSVDDAATQKLMTRFYENLWQKKVPKLEALRQAQLSLLYKGVHASSGSRPRHLTHSSEELPAPSTARENPYLWAAWVLSGDPGDLSQIVSAYPPVAADSPGSRWPISPWLLAAALAICWTAWRRFRLRNG